jgi:bifunctional UDP-N-acetylglucosamine pyrophosphorylase / glucosamine-1-phosphate N-acetyltransferase
MADTQGFVAIVLAAGHGTRMKSALPKVLHPLLGRAMIHYPVQAALDAGAEHVVVVVGHGRERVEAELARRGDGRVRTAVQAQQRGTGDAARCGADALPHFEGRLLVLNGDAAVITRAPIERLIARAAAAGSELALLTSTLPDAHGYGRILRDGQGRVTAVREQRDCSAEQAALREFDPGVYAIAAPFFRSAVQRLSAHNAQGELYLTDLVALAAEHSQVADLAWDAAELEGVNDRAELAARERDLRLRLNRAHALRGVTIRDPESAFIDADVELGVDVTIESQVHLRGRCVIGQGAHVDVGCVLRDVRVQPRARLLPYTIATQSEIGEGAHVGPFSHVRPDSTLGPDTHVGNFVETKKTRMGRGSKANHLAYLGDGVIGEDVNVGAGTIFCNYDGYAKHTTVLEDRAFIGSDSQLVAPVTVGEDGYVATGTTVTKDVPAGDLAIGRARQENKRGLGVRLRAKLKAEAERLKSAKDKGAK